MNFVDELSKVVLPEKIVVPAVFEPQASNISALETVSFISIYGQAQKTLRKMASGIYSHNERKKLAEAEMGLVNPYLLCEQGFYGNWSPVEKLKLLSLLGDVDKMVHNPVVEILARTALSPETQVESGEEVIVPLDDPEYWSKRNMASVADIRFWQDARRGYPQSVVNKIAEMGRKWHAEKYGTASSQRACGSARPHEMYPWKQEMVAVKYWNEHREEVVGDAVRKEKTKVNLGCSPC